MADGTCQCGCGRPVALVRENEQPDQPYRLCAPCATRLESYALRPREWFRLASIHSPWKFDLHDDFYSNSGVADQPEIPVERERGQMRAPTLRESARNAERLFDYAYTRHFLDPPLAEAFRALDPESVHAALEPGLILRVPNPPNVAMACAIAADALGPRAADFVRRGLTEANADTFPGFALAASVCLPCEEALAWALGFLDDLDVEERAALKDALIPFGDARILDWMEARTGEIEAASRWESLAAASAFDWPRARAWLARGRPLSLVALGALNLGIGYEIVPDRLQSERIARLNLPNDAEVLDILDAYAIRDPAPNPTTRIEDIRNVLAARAN